MNSQRAILTDEWEILLTSKTLDERIDWGTFDTIFGIEKSKYAKLQGRSAVFGDKNCKVVVKLLKGKISTTSIFSYSGINGVITVGFFVAQANQMELNDFWEQVKLMKTIGYHRNVLSLLGCSTISKQRFIYSGAYA